MKRRKILTSAGAIAATALAGCGGGGDDGQGLGAGNESTVSYRELDASGPPELLASNSIESADQSSGREQAAGTTASNNLVAEAGHYQVEIVFATLAPVNVYLQDTLIAAKSTTLGTSHIVAFARMDVGSSNVPYVYLKFDLGGGTKYLIATGSSSPLGSRYLVNNPDAKAVGAEWTVYDPRSPTIVLFYARFYKIDDGKPGDHFYSSTIITNTALHTNGGGLTKTLPQLHAVTGTATHVNHEAAIIRHSTGADTLCLPNHQYIGHDELYKSLNSASDQERPYLQRRLSRHMYRFTKEKRTKYGAGADKNPDQMNSILNEFARVVGGHAWIERINSVRSDITSHVDNFISQVGSGFEAYMNNQVTKLDTQGLFDATRNLQTSLAADTIPGNVAGTASVSTQFQVGGAITSNLSPLAPYVTGLGGRISLGICRASATSSGGGYGIASTYRIGATGVAKRVGLTFIIKGPSTTTGLWKPLGSISGDIEISANLTSSNNAVRIDLMQIDPVIDFATKTWASTVLIDCIKGLITTAAGQLAGAQFSFPSATSVAVPSAVSTTASASVSGTANTLRNSAWMGTVEPAVDDILADTGSFVTRSYSILELSPFRIQIYHKHVNDTTVPFSGGFVYGGAAWSPAIRYLPGAGLFASNASGASIQINGFARVLCNVEFSLVFADAAGVRALTGAWRF